MMACSSVLACLHARTYSSTCAHAYTQHAYRAGTRTHAHAHARPHPPTHPGPQLRVAGIIEAGLNPHLEEISEVGVDEMQWDDMSKNEMVWTSVREVGRPPAGCGMSHLE